MHPRFRCSVMCIYLLDTTRTFLAISDSTSALTRRSMKGFSTCGSAVVRASGQHNTRQKSAATRRSEQARKVSG